MQLPGKRWWWMWPAALAVSACSGSSGDDNVTGSQPSNTASMPQQPAVPPPGTGPDAKTPLAPVNSIRESLPEPKAPIDPKSAQAAAQVVQHYGALIEPGRWTASRDLWSSAEQAKAFERNFRTYADVHLEIGHPGDAEGAAGSIYVTEPVTFYGQKNGGGDYRRTANVILRRVNDVPGSTPEQRRWHIERIDWTG